MIIEEIIKYNEQFVANKGYEKYNQQVSRQEACYLILYGYQTDGTPTCSTRTEKW